MKLLSAIILYNSSLEVNEPLVRKRHFLLSKVQRSRKFRKDNFKSINHSRGMSGYEAEDYEFA